VKEQPLEALDFVMRINQKLLGQITSDLGLDQPFVKGRTISVNKCWHFCTDGNAVDAMFYNDDDFVNGMNRVYVVVQKYKVIILAFCLMDTHIHFVLYGDYGECLRFMHDYVRRTSWYISVRYGERHKFDAVPIHHQVVDTDFYLKKVICYTVKNPPSAGIRHNGWDYPWSSGPLYFRQNGLWASPLWLSDIHNAKLTTQLGYRERLSLLKTKQEPVFAAHIIGQMVFPGDYVAYEIVERIFKTQKGYNYFYCLTKEEDIDAREGLISHLSIPMQEMRQHKSVLCKEMFGTSAVKGLSMQQRLRLARALYSRYNSSKKQIARLCGLIYDQVGDII